MLFRVLHNAEDAAEVHTLPAATRALIWSAQDHHEDKDEDECSYQTSDELSQAEPVSLTKRAKKRKGVLTVVVAHDGSHEFGAKMPRC